MKTKLNAIIKKHSKLSEQMADPDVYSNQKKLTEIAKEHRSIDGVVLAPSEFSTTLAFAPSIIATHEFVVPKSIPMTLPIIWPFE